MHNLRLQHQQAGVGRGNPVLLNIWVRRTVTDDITMGVSASADYTGPGAWSQNLEIARAEVGKRLIEVQERQKQCYDARHRPVEEFQQGEEVLVYKPFRKVGRAEKLLNTEGRTNNGGHREEDEVNGGCANRYPPGKAIRGISQRRGENDGAGRDETSLGTGA